MTTKESNPKDVVGSRKLDMGLVPDTLIVRVALAFLEGALKYGRFNWRIAGVKASVYNAAMRRHLKKWWNGQNCDSKTKVHHLENLIACAGIVLDAELYGKLDDDRPPCPDPDAMARLIDESEERIRHLKAEFADHFPHQFTIRDTPPRTVEDGREWGHGVNCECRPTGLDYPHARECPTRRRIPA